MKKILAQIKPQTVVGWTVGWVAAVLVNALLDQDFNWNFWAALNLVLLIRMTTDFIYAYHDAKQTAGIEK